MACTGVGKVGDFKFKIHGEASDVKQVSQAYIDHGFKNMSARREKRAAFIESNWEKITAFACGVVFVALMLIVAITIPNPSTTQWFVFRVVLALAAAGIGAVIPGLIVVNVSKVVRAGGAIALFVLVYLLNPPLLVTPAPQGSSIQQTTGGTNSPAVVSGGDVVIGGEKKAEKAKGTK